MQGIIDAFKPFIIAVIVIYAFTIIGKMILKEIKAGTFKKGPKQADAQTKSTPAPKASTDYTHAYQRRPLLSENERNSFWKIKMVADELGVLVFTKVRLFDLVEPIKGADYRTAMWKVQAKHVDFLVCNKNMDAKLVIELDDSSHQRKDRQERDEFVDDVLTNTGYTIIHANYINPEQLRHIINETVLNIPYDAATSAQS